jgi:GNAT superfamily N-acetyltransferase
MDVNIAIRRAEREDLPQLLELYKHLTVAGDPVVTAEECAARFRELAADPRHVIYVAESEHRIVGTFALILLGGLTHGARDSCVVEDVVVSPALQGRGVGKQMMRFAMDRCAALDCYKLVLSSHLQRERAHRFYESLAFRRHGYSYLIELGARGH